jgi:dTDP-4-dehydrorhamnose 3,5-epimerase
MSMEVWATAIADVKLIRVKRYADPRGFFEEAYSRRRFAAAGIELDFVQDNHSYSAPRGTVRGLHFQKPPAAQSKLIRVVRGAIADVVVDCRRGSPTYGRHAMVELDAADGVQLLCPRGFAHGFVTLEPDTEVIYKVDAYYAPELESGIRWDDPDLAIAWPVQPEEVVLSEKDRELPSFSQLPAIFPYG